MGFKRARVEIIAANERGFGMVPVDGYTFEIGNGTTAIAHKLYNGRWYVSDVETGRGITAIAYKSRKDAAAAAERIIRNEKKD